MTPNNRISLTLALCKLPFLSPSILINMADTTESITQDTANLHLDEATGERVSKSELKKRQKQRQAEEKKKEKAAAAPPKQEKKTAKREAEEELTPNVGFPCPFQGIQFG